jgi:transcriptional regulator with XRE-family HTH domain
VDFARLGSIFRAVRIKKGWRQFDVASKSGVTRSSVSRLERGHARELRLDELVRIAEVLEISLRILATWRGGELDRLMNARHSGLHESVARWFVAKVGWVVAPEVSYSIYGERGTIDILAWHAATRTLLVIELKTEIVDVNDLLGRVDQKRRLAAEIARERGWFADAIAVWVIVAQSRTNRRRVERHKTTLRAAFPADGRTVMRWIAGPAGPVSALSYWPDAPGESTNARLATVKRVRKPAAAAW